MKTLTATAALLGIAAVLAGQADFGERHEAGDTVAVAETPAGAGMLAAAGTPSYAADVSDVSDEALTAVVQRYCVVCHNDQLLTGNLSLQALDVENAHESAETAERMIRKLRAGMMPPPGMPRPGGDTLVALAETLEEVVDDAADRNPNPGERTFQRLNRPEYQRTIRELLGLEVDAGEWLPLDQKSENFDNIADVQALSPTLLESYLNAASEISRMAVGDRNAPSVTRKYSVPVFVSQHPWDHVEGAPYGTRGGTVVHHVFPVDAEYVFEMELGGGRDARMVDIDISIDGERVALIPYESGLPAKTDPIFIRAGQHRVSAAFVKKTEGPYEDLIRPHDWALAGGGSGGSGVTTLPHLEALLVTGPMNPTGLSETATRQRIFTCRPTVASEERTCAEQIVTRLATEAYRRTPTERDLDGLMSFYETGAADGGFEEGVRMALQAILASPYFVFRLESEPENARPGRSYEIADNELASRLSYFLWGAPPDQELMSVASQGKLTDDDVLEEQTRRMLADPRTEALSERFAAQWLRLQDLEKVRPDPNVSPNFDENVGKAMLQETQLFFTNLVREDRSFLDLFTADYTFVNERLARHYGIPNVSGSDFRRVTYPEGSQRRGLLGQGSVLVLTSMANRTSPVLRGKWVMEVLLGTPPPPPPPGVPDLEETEGSKDGRFLTTRERMELHRANPTCNACHQFMDPIGLALDNFDNTARLRNRENGMALDTRGTFYDGTEITTPAELVDVLMQRPIPLVRNFTTNLLAYALGRRIEYTDQPVVREIAEQAAEDEYRMSAFILGVVRSEPFRMKMAEVVTQEASR